MKRIRQGELATLVVEASAAPELTLTRASTGAVLGPYEAEAAPGGYGVELLPAHVAELESFEAVWTLGGSVIARETVEIVGGFLFELSELANVNLGGKVVAEKFSEAEREAVRVLAETAIEDACGIAFVPRLAVDRLIGTGSGTLALPHTRVRAIRTVNGEDTTATVDPAGLVYGWWTCGRTYEVVYEHGLSSPPPRVSHAALLLAKRWLAGSTVDDRATSMSTPEGVTYAFVTAGVRGAVFDVPEVNAVVATYRSRAVIA